MLAWRRRRTGAGRVSVVIPLYNHAAYIGEAVASVLDQGPILRELVVLDDGSSDHSAATMQRLAAKDPRIRFERQPNAGAHATINTALGWCSGELVAILNSDDIFLPGRLQALATTLDGADIAASALAFMDGAGASVSNPWYQSARQTWQDGMKLPAALLNGNFIMTTSNLMFRRALLDDVGGFAALRYTHDLDWLLRALALGHRVAVNDRPLLRYRMHATNTIKEDHGRVRAEWALSAAAYLATLWDRPGAAPVDWDLAATVQTVLRTHQLDLAVPPAMLYLRRSGAPTLDHSPLLQDAAFLDRVRAWT